MNTHFDVQRSLLTFYFEHVCLGKARRAELAQHRDACLERLREGLRKLGERPRSRYKNCNFVRHCDQGSYAMHTLNQHPTGEYDIDVAVIFDKEHLPASPLRARKRLADALRATLNNFAIKPRARTNAVTVWYTGDFRHHVDLAVYRQSKGDGGDAVLEHAGSEWRARDPQQVNDWFSERVKTLSPGVDSGATVKEWQFRRIVRLVKAFARSRRSWKLPGGMILSTLVAEVYRPHPHRDDVALHETLLALRARLNESLEVRSPVAADVNLTQKPEIAAQMRRLLGKLDLVLPKLEILKDPACLELSALNAWYWVFNHSYWREQVREARLAASFKPASIELQVGLAKHKGGKIKSRYRSGKAALSKGTWLRLYLQRSFKLKPPFVVHWIVQNRGMEARAAGDVPHEYTSSEREFWQQTAYEGRHLITCKIIKDGRVVAQGQRHIRVSKD